MDVNELGTFVVGIATTLVRYLCQAVCGVHGLVCGQITNN